MQQQSKPQTLTRRTAALVASAAFVLVAAMPAQAQNPVQIGVITSLTGTNAVQGEDIRRGIQLAVERVNSGYEVPMKNGNQQLGPGLVDGRTVEPMIEDTESRPASAMDATRKLINVDGVEVILGEFSSGLTVPTGQHSNSNGVVQIGIGSTSPKLADIGPYFFNAIGTDRLMGRSLAEFAHEDSGVDQFTSIAPNNPFGVGIEIQSCERLAEIGGECINTSRYELEQSDYRPIIEATMRGDPQAGFFTAYGTEARLILRQMYEGGHRPPEGWYADYPSMWANEIQEIAQVGEGIKGLEPGVSGDFYRNEYASAYEETYGERPTTAFGAYGYDAAMLVMLAIAEAGEVSADAIRDQLPAVAERYQGVSGDKTFDDNGMQVNETYQRVIYQDGELVDYEG